jgi:hypothetical protein
VRRSNSSTTPRAADGEHRSVMALQPEDPLRTPHSWRRGRSYPRATVRAPAIPWQVGGQVCSVFGPCVRVLTGAVAGLVRAGWRGEPALRPPYRSSVSERSETEQAVATGFSCLGRDPLAPLACRVHLTPDGPGPPHVRCPVPGVKLTVRPTTRTLCAPARRRELLSTADEPSSAHCHSWRRPGVRCPAWWSVP